MSDSTFKVVGVDLAAQPKDTAYCVICVDGGKAQVQLPKCGKKCAADDSLLELFRGGDSVCAESDGRNAADDCPPAMIGIDAPFGWPIGLIGALSEHRLTNRWPLHDPAVYPGDKRSDYTIGNGSDEEFRDLKYRTTDFHVWNNVREWKWDREKKKTELFIAPRRQSVKPISVVVDKLGSVAMRCASLLSRAASYPELEVDRSGRTGKFVEVYPAAAFARWAIPFRNQDLTETSKTKQCVRDWMFREMGRFAERWVFDEWPIENAFTKSDHCLDAFAAALVALMVALDPKRDAGLIEPVSPECQALAKTEGWIALPEEDSLKELHKRIDEWKWEPPPST